MKDSKQQFVNGVKRITYGDSNDLIGYSDSDSDLLLV